MSNLSVEILSNIHYRRQAGLPTPHSLVTRAFKAIGELGPISAEYHDTITQALIDFFEGAGMQAVKGRFKRAVSNAFNDAFDLGWIQGGQEFPVDDDANEWVGNRMNQEFAFVDSLFQQAKELKKEPDFAYPDWIAQRADGYVATLQSVYNAGVLWAKKNQVLTWQLGQTEKHCSTCASLDGKSHRASWYIAHDYIPRKPGAAMKCGGYNCDCKLVDKEGNEITL